MIYQVLGLEPLKSRWWDRRLSCMTMKEEATDYLINSIPKCERSIRTKHNRILPTYKCQTDCIKFSFFPSTLNDCLNLYVNISNSKSNSLFKGRWSYCIHPIQSNIYNMFDQEIMKLQTTYTICLTKKDRNFRQHIQYVWPRKIETSDNIYNMFDQERLKLQATYTICLTKKDWNFRLLNIMLTVIIIPKTTQWP